MSMKHSRIYLLPYKEYRRLQRRALRAQRLTQDEVCGFVFAKRSGLLRLHFVPNSSERPWSFVRDRAAIQEVRSQLGAEGWHPFAGFHSHIASEAIPSQGDIAGAFYNGRELIYDICGTQ